MKCFRRIFYPTLVLLAGCASPPPPEFELYTAAFDQSRAAAEAVVKVWEPIEKAQRAPPADTFEPDQAAYISDAGRAGNAALIERGFETVGAYDDLLKKYAEGDSVSSLDPLAGAFSANVAALAVTLGTPGLGVAAAPAVEGMKALASALLAVSDRAEFSRAVKENSGNVDAFLAQTRAFTGDMYIIAQTHANNRRAELIEIGRRDDARKIPDDLAAFRRMLASWVLTIDDTRKALGALEDAVVRDEKAGVTLGAVVFWTGELNRHAEAVKFAAFSISDAF